MRTLRLVLSVGCLLVVTGISRGQVDVQRFEVDSRAVEARYSVEVVLPAAAAGEAKRYPVLYCTDWFVLGDYLKSLPRLLGMGRLTEPFILVGIAQGTDMNEWAMGRTRDFTPAPPTDGYSKENTYAPAIELAGGAAQFVTFLKTELIPRIDSEYPSDPARRGFAGYSLGSLLGVHILAHDPSLFRYYLLGSPSLWWNAYDLAFAFAKTPPERLAPDTRIYLSVGADESWEMLKGYGILRDALREMGFGAPDLKAEIIGGAGHVGAMPTALYDGIRFLLPRE